MSFPSTDPLDELGTDFLGWLKDFLILVLAIGIITQ